jgi:hypothetical protein
MPSLGQSYLLDPVVAPESPTPRKVGMPLSALTPAPARMKIRSVGAMASIKLAQNRMSLSGASNESLPSLRFTLARK